MRSQFAVALGLGAMLVAVPAAAQEEPTAAIYGTYYRCDMTRQARADTIIREVMAPIFDRHLEAGHLTSWGWVAHSIGGGWRRVRYYIAPTRAVLLDTRRQIVAELASEHGERLQEFVGICGSHDDYIWTSVAGSESSPAQGQARPEAALSTYYVCETARENRADELVTEVFAPIFNHQVEAGTISSWSWLAHSVGGRFRRVAVMDGPDHESILNARDAIVEAVQNDHPDEGREFSEICGGHTDYLWEIQISRP